MNGDCNDGRTEQLCYEFTTAWGLEAQFARSQLMAFCRLSPNVAVIPLKSCCWKIIG